MVSTWATRCPCRSRTTATTLRLLISWSGCGVSTSARQRVRRGLKVAHPCPRVSGSWSAVPVLELYTSEPNTFFLKPLIALAEKGAAFTIRYFDAAALQQFSGAMPVDLESELHLEREGPLLVHDGAIISNSFFMLEYISERFPGAALLP